MVSLLLPCTARSITGRYCPFLSSVGRVLPLTQDGVHLLDEDTLSMVEAHGTKVLDTRCVDYTRLRSCLSRMVLVDPLHVEFYLSDRGVATPPEALERESSPSWLWLRRLGLDRYRGLELVRWPRDGEAAPGQSCAV